MENIEYKKAVISYRVYMEIIALATLFGLIFPVIFLWSNKSKIPQASTLSLLSAILVALIAFLYILSSGEIFPRLRLKWIIWILYGWGSALLILAAYLVYCTGGVQSSIFVWLFNYAFIVTIIVRPKHGQTFFIRWRPVLLTVGIEILIIGILVCSGGHAIRVPDTIQKSMAIWGGTSVGYSLIVSLFVFYVSTKRFEGGIKNV